MELKASLDRHMLDKRAHLWLFDDDMRRVHPSCAGDWMEFGVFTGGSINMTAVWRRTHCGAGCPPVFGFDTFTGRDGCRRAQASALDDSRSSNPSSTAKSLSGLTF